MTTLQAVLCRSGFLSSFLLFLYSPACLAAQDVRRYDNQESSASASTHAEQDAGAALEGAATPTGWGNETERGVPAPVIPQKVDEKGGQSPGRTGGASAGNFGLVNFPNSYVVPWDYYALSQAAHAVPHSKKPTLLQEGGHKNPIGIFLRSEHRSNHFRAKRGRARSSVSIFPLALDFESYGTAASGHGHVVEAEDPIIPDEELTTPSPGLASYLGPTTGAGDPSAAAFPEAAATPPANDASALELPVSAEWNFNSGFAEDIGGSANVFYPASSFAGMHTAVGFSGRSGGRSGTWNSQTILYSPYFTVLQHQAEQESSNAGLSIFFHRPVVVLEINLRHNLPDSKSYTSKQTRLPSPRARAAMGYILSRKRSTGLEHVAGGAVGGGRRANEKVFLRKVVGEKNAGKAGSSREKIFGDAITPVTELQFFGSFGTGAAKDYTDDNFRSTSEKSKVQKIRFWLESLKVSYLEDSNALAQDGADSSILPATVVPPSASAPHSPMRIMLSAMALQQEEMSLQKMQEETKASTSKPQKNPSEFAPRTLYPESVFFPAKQVLRDHYSAAASHEAGFFSAPIRGQLLSDVRTTLTTGAPPAVVEGRRLTTAAEDAGQEASTIPAPPAAARTTTTKNLRGSSTTSTLAPPEEEADIFRYVNQNAVKDPKATPSTGNLRGSASAIKAAGSPTSSSSAINSKGDTIFTGGAVEMKASQMRSPSPLPEHSSTESMLEEELLDLLVEQVANLPELHFNFDRRISPTQQMKVFGVSCLSLRHFLREHVLSSSEKDHGIADRAIRAAVGWTNSNPERRAAGSNHDSTINDHQQRGLRPPPDLLEVFFPVEKKISALENPFLPVEKAAPVESATDKASVAEQEAVRTDFVKLQGFLQKIIFRLDLNADSSVVKDVILDQITREAAGGVYPLYNSENVLHSSGHGSTSTPAGSFAGAADVDVATFPHKMANDFQTNMFLKSGMDLDFEFMSAFWDDHEHEQDINYGEIKNQHDSSVLPPVAAAGDHFKNSLVLQVFFHSIEKSILPKLQTRGELSLVRDVFHQYLTALDAEARGQAEEKQQAIALGRHKLFKFLHHVEQLLEHEKLQALDDKQSDVLSREDTNLNTNPDHYTLNSWSFEIDNKMDENKLLAEEEAVLYVDWNTVVAAEAYNFNSFPILFNTLAHKLRSSYHKEKEEEFAEFFETSYRTLAKKLQRILEFGESRLILKSENYASGVQVDQEDTKMKQKIAEDQSLLEDQKKPSPAFLVTEQSVQQEFFLPARIRLNYNCFDNAEHFVGFHHTMGTTTAASSTPSKTGDTCVEVVESKKKNRDEKNTPEPSASTTAAAPASENQIYRVGKRLGQGGYGAVYELIEPHRQGEERVIKFISPPKDSRLMDEAVLQLFLTRKEEEEERSLGKARHCVPKLYKLLFLEQGEYAREVMIRGNSGKDYKFSKAVKFAFALIMEKVNVSFEDKGAFAQSNPVVETARELFQCLEMLHDEYGTHHHDLKPLNIGYTIAKANEKSKVLLLDLGMGVTLDKATDYRSRWLEEDNLHFELARELRFLPKPEYLDINKGESSSTKIGEVDAGPPDEDINQSHSGRTSSTARSSGQQPEIKNYSILTVVQPEDVVLTGPLHRAGTWSYMHPVRLNRYYVRPCVTVEGQPFPIPVDHGFVFELDFAFDLYSWGWTVLKLLEKEADTLASGGGASARKRSRKSRKRQERVDQQLALANRLAAIREIVHSYVMSLPIFFNDVDQHERGPSSEEKKAIQAKRRLDDECVDDAMFVRYVVGELFETSSLSVFNNKKHDPCEDLEPDVDGDNDLYHAGQHHYGNNKHHSRWEGRGAQWAAEQRNPLIGPTEVCFKGFPVDLVLQEMGAAHVVKQQIAREENGGKNAAVLASSSMSLLQEKMEAVWELVKPFVMPLPFFPDYLEYMSEFGDSVKPIELHHRSSTDSNNATKHQVSGTISAKKPTFFHEVTQSSQFLLRQFEKKRKKELFQSCSRFVEYYFQEAGPTTAAATSSAPGFSLSSWQQQQDAAIAAQQQAVYDHYHSTAGAGIQHDLLGDDQFRVQDHLDTATAGSMHLHETVSGQVQAGNSLL
ncbi:unnamed protein product [Amoebophrya sp. A120]|nr:unnamed protein product [Amoebophrya sp. A120]|eukprot:GSA120T00012512001.1